MLLTVFWHYRSTPKVRARHVWASSRTVKALSNRGVTVISLAKRQEEVYVPGRSAPPSPTPMTSRQAAVSSRRGTVQVTTSFLTGNASCPRSSSSR